MASLMENLIEVLDKESQEYENLLDLSLKKTPVIVSGSLDELAKITDEEQIIVGNITHLEHDREGLFKDIANVINKDVKTLKLSDLITILGQRPEEQQKLAKVYDRLKAAVHELERVNGQNRALIENALEMVQFDMNVIQAMKAGPETANYNRGAYNTGDQIGMGPQGFDAKQ